MEDLKKLLAAATPGPWQIVMARNDDGVTSYMIREHTHPSVVVERDQYWEDDYQPKTDADGYWLPDENMDALPHRTGNAALIVAAVNALPELLAKVKRLEAVLGDAENALRGGIEQYASRTFTGSIVAADEQFPWIVNMMQASHRARAALSQETKP